MPYKETNTTKYYFFELLKITDSFKIENPTLSGTLMPQGTPPILAVIWIMTLEATELRFLLVRFLDR